jgi:hypothetical protein
MAARCSRWVSHQLSQNPLFQLDAALCTCTVRPLRNQVEATMPRNALDSKTSEDSLAVATTHVHWT